MLPRHRFYQFLTLASLLFLGGCVKTYQLLRDEVPQAEQHKPAHRAIKDYLRSVTVYEGFETRAHFDALWMSDSMRHMYTALHAKKVGHTPQEEEAFLLRQLEENKQTITFYLLSEIYNRTHISMNDKNATWSVYLTGKNGLRVAPKEVKEVEIAPEIQYMFGHRFVPFKNVYCLKFPARDIVKQPYFNVGDQFSLVCAGSAISGKLTWTVLPAMTRAQLQKEHRLKDGEEESFFGFVKTLARPKEEDTDFFW